MPVQYPSLLHSVFHRFVNPATILRTNPLCQSLWIFDFFEHLLNRTARRQFCQAVKIHRRQVDPLGDGQWHAAAYVEFNVFDLFDLCRSQFAHVRHRIARVIKVRYTRKYFIRTWKSNALLLRHFVDAALIARCLQLIVPFRTGYLYYWAIFLLRFDLQRVFVV